jgi:hypothetical protein
MAGVVYFIIAPHSRCRFSALHVRGDINELLVGCHGRLRMLEEIPDFDAATRSAMWPAWMPQCEEPS